MFIRALAPLLALPFVAADGIHKLKLKKLPLSISNPSLEGAYLAEKYGSQSTPQMPLMGTGGAGRRIDNSGRKGGKDLFWTQEEAFGGHNVPLSSMFMFNGNI